MINIKLLIIDDEERFLKTTKALLDKKGWAIYTASDGLSGLEIMENKLIDVIILDVKMPGIDGVEVLRRIKTKYPLVEVIMLTGHSTTESAVQGLKLGAYDYLIKPCEISVLQEKVESAYDKKTAMEEKIRQAKIDRIISHPLEVFTD